MKTVQVHSIILTTLIGALGNSGLLTGAYRMHYNASLSIITAVFRQEEFSTRNDNFFRFLTPTLHWLVFKQKKIPLAPSGKFRLVKNGF